MEGLANLTLIALNKPTAGGGRIDHVIAGSLGQGNNQAFRVEHVHVQHSACRLWLMNGLERTMNAGQEGMNRLVSSSYSPVAPTIVLPDRTP